MILRPLPARPDAAARGSPRRGGALALGAGLVLGATLALDGCAARASSPEDWWTARFADADTVAIAELGPGVRHGYLWLPDGPWAVHVVAVDEAVCDPDMAAIKAGPPLGARARTSELGASAIAAINADFFMLPGGTPVGAHVRAGRVLAGPGARPIYAIDEAGGHWAGPAELEGYAVTGRDSVALALVNRPLTGGRHHPVGRGVALFDEWYGDTVPRAPAGATVRVLDDVAGGEVQGGRVGVVVAAGPAEAPVTRDEGHVALRTLGAEAASWLQRRAAGDTIRWWARVVPARVPGGDADADAGDADAGRGTTAGRAAAGRAAAEAVGGFPMLVADGRGVYAEQEGVIATFGPVRHPRTAVGWDETRRRVFWVVVDGRQAPYSDGMSLPELEWLMLRLGATHALNLDGGGSTALVVGGQVANRPSDPLGERAVANILALQGCRGRGG